MIEKTALALAGHGVLESERMFFVGPVQANLLEGEGWRVKRTGYTRKFSNSMQCEESAKDGLGNVVCHGINLLEREAGRLGFRESLIVES